VYVFLVFLICVVGPSLTDGTLHLAVQRCKELVLKHKINDLNNCFTYSTSENSTRANANANSTCVQRDFNIREKIDNDGSWRAL
jgi:hypothetical protein